MKISGLIEEDFVNYKLPSMTVMFPYCTFKCNTDCGYEVCQNYYLKDSDLFDISTNGLVERYVNNPISESIVMQGLEPFDSFNELYSLIYKFTEKSNDDIVIYTGYNKGEIEDKIADLKNIIDGNKFVIKFGRFIPNSKSKYDEVLGVVLQSDNQYAEVI